MIDQDKANEIIYAMEMHLQQARPFSGNAGELQQLTEALSQDVDQLRAVIEADEPLA
jgi:uncharacterized protein YukE